MVRVVLRFLASIALLITVLRKRRDFVNPTVLQTALAAAGLQDVAPDLTRLAQPAIRLTTQPVAEQLLASGASKLGGSADLPSGTTWPVWKNIPMSFIGQLRLADVAHLAGAQDLPATGLLSFFYDAQQQTYGADPADRGGWQTQYYTGDLARLQRMPFPANLPASGRFTPCAVTCSAILTLPEQPKLDDPALAWTPDAEQRYEQFWAAYPSPTARATPQHQVLGHPDTLQDDMRLQCQLAAHGVASSNDPRAAELSAGALQWRLLFQVDSDDHTGMHWGDGGLLYYWMQRADLQACRFDQTWFVLQSS